MSTPVASELKELLDTVSATGPVRTDIVQYHDEDTILEGFAARPDDTTEALRPGVLVLHDWYGRSDHVRTRAHMLARLGYIALTGDIYGANVTVHSPQQAYELAGTYTAEPALLRRRVMANLAALRADPDRVAVIGYCFGGAAALELARSGERVAMVVTFHANLDTRSPAEPDSITSPIRVLTGADDPIVPAATVHAFEEELRAAGAPDWQIVTYSHAMHAFAVPGANAPEPGAQFHPATNRRSWNAMTAFLNEAFA